MINSKKNLVFVFLLIVILSAQGWSMHRLQFGIHFSPFFPLEEFKTQLDGMGWGGGLDFSYRLPRSPLYVGLSASYFIYGSQSRWEPMSVYLPDIQVKVITTNSLINGFVFLRFQPPRGELRPYLDGLIGFQHLTTDTRLRFTDYDDDGLPSTNHWNDTAIGYGVGGGLMIDLLRKGGRRSRPFSVELDIGFRYIKGGTATYLTEDSIEISENEIVYYYSESATDLVAARIGVSFGF
jgi:hypothetical protein